MWIKKVFDMGGVEWGWFELGFCLLRVGGLKYVVKVYYLKLIKKILIVGWEVGVWIVFFLFY